MTQSAAQATCLGFRSAHEIEDYLTAKACALPAPRLLLR